MKRRKYQKCIAYVIGVTMLLSGMRLSVYAEESTDNTEIVYDQEENEAPRCLREISILLFDQAAARFHNQPRKRLVHHDQAQCEHQRRNLH